MEIKSYKLVIVNPDEGSVGIDEENIIRVLKEKYPEFDFKIHFTPFVEMKEVSIVGGISEDSENENYIGKQSERFSEDICRSHIIQIMSYMKNLECFYRNMGYTHESISKLIDSFIFDLTTHLGYELTMSYSYHFYEKEVKAEMKNQQKALK